MDDQEVDGTEVADAPRGAVDRDVVSGKFVSKSKSSDEAFEAAADKFFAGMDAVEGAKMVPGLPKASKLEGEGEEEQPDAEPSKDGAAAGKPVEVDKEVDSHAVEAGLSALKRLKVPAKVIDGMTKPELAEYGKEAARQTAEKDSLFCEVGELRKQVGKSKAKDSESAQAEQPEDDLKAELELLSATLDDDAVKAVGGAIKKLDARSRTQIAELREQIAQLRGASEIDEISEVLAGEAKTAGLVERFPQLSDEKFIRRTLVPMMGKMNADGEYTSAEGVVDRSTLMLHAARAVCEEKPSQTPSPRRKVADPVTDTTRARPKPKSMDEVFERAHALASKDAPLDQIRASLR